MGEQSTHRHQTKFLNLHRNTEACDTNEFSLKFLLGFQADITIEEVHCSVESGPLESNFVSYSRHPVYHSDSLAFESLVAKLLAQGMLVELIDFLVAVSVDLGGVYLATKPEFLLSGQVWHPADNLTLLSVVLLRFC